MRYTDADDIIAKIKELKSEITEMDLAVRNFLADRQKYRNPSYETLVNRIRQFEREVHMFRNTEVQLRLDGLMNSIMVYDRSWKQLFANDEARYLAQKKREEEGH